MIYKLILQVGKEAHDRCVLASLNRYRCDKILIIEALKFGLNDLEFIASAFKVSPHTLMPLFPSGLTQNILTQYPIILSYDQAKMINVCKLQNVDYKDVDIMFLHDYHYLEWAYKSSSITVSHKIDSERLSTDLFKKNIFPQVIDNSKYQWIHTNSNVDSVLKTSFK